MKLEEYKKKNPIEYALAKENGMSDKRIKKSLEFYYSFSNIIDSLGDSLLEIAKKVNKDRNKNIQLKGGKNNGTTNK